MSNRYNNQMFVKYESQNLLGTECICFNDELTKFKKRMYATVELEGDIATVLKNICEASDGLENAYVEPYDGYDSTYRVYGWEDIDPSKTDIFRQYVIAEQK
jgi:hypothetical protein